ncbi:isochorismate synthase [Bacillaceae bacterium Marseille-Q3522]|nr:isochorismate synthase [Bacillaceae bacterium Marseille-Q3522]
MEGSFLITLEDVELKEGIIAAKKKAAVLAKPILVSHVRKIDWIDPGFFFCAGMKKFKGERFFWKDAAGDMTLAGLGICQKIVSEETKNRFIQIEKEWKRFTKDAVLLSSTKMTATGPVLFGGFSFDPLKRSTPLWRNFPSALFHVPTYMVTSAGGESYFTTNIICEENTDLTFVNKLMEERQAIFYQKLPKSQTRLTIECKAEINPLAWKGAVKEIVKQLHTSTSLKKVVLARELRVQLGQAVQTEAVLSQLLKQQSESFIFAFEEEGDCFIGASPERLVKKTGELVYSDSLAGSIGRSKDKEEDTRLSEILRRDEKNLIEHQYVAEAIISALKEVCSEVNVSRLQLKKMRDITHLHTPITGRMERTHPLLSLVERLHPTPALGGYPKNKAMEKIRELEQMDRGFYASPIGWLDAANNGEFAVAIRSSLIQGKEASLFAGCGIVRDSDADREYEETKLKFLPILSAFGGEE